MSVCILLSTCDKYQKVAEYTLGIINEKWYPKPDVFICGLSQKNSTYSSCPLLDDPRDWMAITYRACNELLRKGYTKCYLILDDHPPIATCNTTHLNNTIPTLLDQFSASVISLYGWGQSGGAREPCGEILSGKYFNIEHLSKDYAWKFSLHPGLWNIESLTEILSVLLEETSSLERRTPWHFERRGGSVEFPVSNSIKENAYRVCGEKMSQNAVKVQVRKVELFVCNVIHFLAMKFCGQQAWKAVFDKLSFIYHYYEGPYPIYWRGVLDKGKLNSDLLKFDKIHRLHLDIAVLRHLEIEK